MLVHMISTCPTVTSLSDTAALYIPMHTGSSDSQVCAAPMNYDTDMTYKSVQFLQPVTLPFDCGTVAYFHFR